MSSPESRSTDRRRFLTGAAGAALAVSAPLASAKGPLVWLDMDQKELDAAYTQAEYAKNPPQVGKRDRFYSDAARKRLGEPKRFSYGKSEIESVDVYTTKARRAPVNVYIRGGGWRSGSGRGQGFAAETFVNAGAHLVTVDYIGIAEAGKNLFVLADQVRRAVAWVRRNAERFDGDPDRIYVSGHSAGGHLAGVVVTTDWEKDFGLPNDIVKGGICASGIYDLRPVRLSVRSTYVDIDDAAEAALSPQRHIAHIHAPLVIAYGTEETPEFQRQARDFTAAVKASGRKAELLVGEGYNHFEFNETFGNPYGVLGRAALEQMKLA